jgi:Holliday junction DNA helicase RuvA
MIAYISGKITIKTPAFVVIDCGGIGYKVNVSLQTYSKIENADHVYLHITEIARMENQTYSGTELYGFYDEQERELFENLISVSGVGASIARIMLSAYKTDEIKSAILTENVSLIQSIKGIGPKTAKRIILELKDKIARSGVPETFLTDFNNKNTEEALSALLALGFPRHAAEKAIAQTAGNNAGASVESLIKNALKLL